MRITFFFFFFPAHVLEGQSGRKRQPKRELPGKCMPRNWLPTIPLPKETSTFWKDEPMKIACAYSWRFVKTILPSKICDENLLNFSGRRGAKGFQRCKVMSYCIPVSFAIFDHFLPFRWGLVVSVFSHFLLAWFLLGFPSGFLLDGFQRCKGMQIL